MSYSDPRPPIDPTMALLARVTRLEQKMESIADQLYAQGLIRQEKN